MNLTRELVAAIDIGTLRTRGVIGRFTSDGKLEIIAFSETLTQGVRNGVVVNIEDDVERAVKAYVMSKPESKFTNKQIADIQVVIYVMVM